MLKKMFSITYTCTEKQLEIKFNKRGQEKLTGKTQLMHTKTNGSHIELCVQHVAHIHVFLFNLRNFSLNAK